MVKELVLRSKDLPIFYEVHMTGENDVQDTFVLIIYFMILNTVFSVDHLMFWFMQLSKVDNRTI